MNRNLLVIGLIGLTGALIGCGNGTKPNPDGGPGGGPTITVTGNTLDPERAIAARTGTLAALFGPAGMTGPCWDQVCDNNAAFELSKLGGVTVGVYGHPEIPTVQSDANGAFSLPGVPQKSLIRLYLDKPNDPIYLKTIDAVPLRTGTVDLHGLPYHLCRNDKIYKALLDKAGPNALDNGAVLALINNNVPLPQNGPINRNIVVKASSGKIGYVGFDFIQKVFIVDDNAEMANYQNATWLGSVLAYSPTTPTVELNVMDTEAFPDPVTGRPYTYPVFTIPVEAHASTFELLYPIPSM